MDFSAGDSYPASSSTTLCVEAKNAINRQVFQELPQNFYPNFLDVTGTAQLNQLEPMDFDFMNDSNLYVSSIFTFHHSYRILQLIQQRPSHTRSRLGRGSGYGSEHV